jgi:hypothetical protein
VYAVNTRLDQLKLALEDSNTKIDEEVMVRSSYLYMMDRMKKDYISSKLNTTDLDLSLKSKTQLVTDQLQRQRMTKEEKLQSKSIFDQLMKNIEKEQKDRQDRIIELQKCIKNKEESVQRRIERQKRNQDIAEAAANENKDATEMKMRD